MLYPHVFKRCVRNRIPASCQFHERLLASGLFLCSTGEPGSALVMGSAMLGRICLDLCFTTIYVPSHDGLSNALDG
jgi:hypothetical protein